MVQNLGGDHLGIWLLRQKNQHVWLVVVCACEVLLNPDLNPTLSGGTSIYTYSVHHWYKSYTQHIVGLGSFWCQLVTTNHIVSTLHLYHVWILQGTSYYIMYTMLLFYMSGIYIIFWYQQNNTKYGCYTSSISIKRGGIDACLS